MTTEITRTNQNQVSNTNEGKLRELVCEFLKDQDVKPNSRTTYRRGLNQFINWISENGLDNLSISDILCFKQALIDRGLSSLTVSNYITSIRRFFEWLELNRIHPNIAKGVKNCRQPKGFRKDSLSLDQAKNLLDITGDSIRDYAIINLMIRAGLRTIEVVRSNVGDIGHVQGQTVLYIQGKGRDTKDEYVVLEPEVLKPINDYLETRGQIRTNEPLFTSASNRTKGQRLSTRTVSWIIKTHLRRIGLDNRRLSAHSLRHTSITFVLLAGGTIQQAQTQGRHTSINTTTRYAHNIDRIKDRPEQLVSGYLGGGVQMKL